MVLNVNELNIEISSFFLLRYQNFRDYKTAVVYFEVISFYLLVAYLQFSKKIYFLPIQVNSKIDLFSLIFVSCVFRLLFGFSALKNTSKFLIAIHISYATFLRILRVPTQIVSLISNLNVKYVFNIICIKPHGKLLQDEHDYSVCRAYDNNALKYFQLAC